MQYVHLNMSEPVLLLFKLLMLKGISKGCIERPQGQQHMRGLYAKTTSLSKCTRVQACLS